MAGKPSAMQLAAKKQWESAPADKKPSAGELARKHKLSDMAIYQSNWWKNRNAAQPQTGEKK